jgi:HK97 family phage major capsid protein
MAPKVSAAQVQHPGQREALLKHSTREVLTPNERTGEYARIKRDGYVQDAAHVLEGAERERRSTSPSEEAVVDSALANAEIWHGRLVDSRARDEQRRERIGVRREPVTYRPASEGGQYSLFADVWASKMGDTKAAERIERHRKESAYEMRKLYREQESRQRNQEQVIGISYEQRVTPSRMIGQGGSFSPPTYLVAQFAAYPRPARVFADLSLSLALPPSTQSVNIPRLSSGTTEQTVADASAQPDTDITDTLVSSPVVTITGTQDVALQLLEQSGPGTAHLDEILFSDLSIALDARTEQEVSGGLGGSKELLGYLNIPGAGSVTTTETTGTGQFKALGETFASVSNNRKLTPECWLMRGGRWAWLATQEDEDHRPLAVPLDMESENVVNPIGVLLGLPVRLTESIPTNLGTSKDQDAIVCARPSDSYLWTSAPTMNVHEGVLSGSLEARLELRAYVAFIAHRFPQSISVLGGSGMKVPSGF